MTALARIALYIVVGYLSRGGWLPQDIADEISSNPDMVWAIEAGISAMVGAGTLAWWRIAKKMGWST